MSVEISSLPCEVVNEMIRYNKFTYGTIRTLMPMLTEQKKFLPIISKPKIVPLNKALPVYLTDLMPTLLSYEQKLKSQKKKASITNSIKNAENMYDILRIVLQCDLVALAKDIIEHKFVDIEVILQQNNLLDMMADCCLYGCLESLKYLYGLMKFHRPHTEFEQNIQFLMSEAKINGHKNVIEWLDSIQKN